MTAWRLNPAAFRKIGPGDRDTGTGRFKPKGAPNTPKRPGMGDLDRSKVTAMAAGWREGVDSAAAYWDPAAQAFTPERQALHDKIVEDALAGLTPGGDPPQFTMLGGGPAAGKSSVLEAGLLPIRPGAAEVNPDLVKEQLPEGDPATRQDGWAGLTHEESSYVAKRIQQAAIERGLDVILDGTGDGQASKVADRIQQARAAGYEVDGFYVTRPTDEAVEGAMGRAARTGRYVPESVIRETHAGVSRIAPEVAPLFDTFEVYDATGITPDNPGTPPKIAEQHRGQPLLVHDTDAWEKFLAKANEEPVASMATDGDGDHPTDAALARITVEVAGGLPKEASALAPLSPALDQAWDRVATGIESIRGQGLDVDVPSPWPDPVETEVAPAGSPVDQPPPPEEAATMQSTQTFTIPAPEVGDPVSFTDPDTGEERTGTVTDVAGLEPGVPGETEPQGTVTITPDDDPTPVTVGINDLATVDDPTAVPAAAPEAMTAKALLVVEGIESGDRRSIDHDALTWRDLPLPFMVMFRNPDGGEGHAAAELAGRIDTIWRDDNDPSKVWGNVTYDDSPVGREAYRLFKQQMMRGVSVDLDSVDMTWEAPDGMEALSPDLPVIGGKMRVRAARIMGATQCAFPAFAEAHLEIADEALVASAGIEAIMHTPFDSTGALVASAGAGPEKPPAAWFTLDPQEDGPYPVRVTEDGRIHGYVAAWGTCHIGFPERCVSVPRSSCAYAQFRTGQTVAEGDDGDVLVPTGPIVTDTVHPDLRLKASDACTFYAHTGAVVGDVVPHEDAHGIFVAGAVRPAATSDQIRALRGGDVSPDWRHVNGRGLECVAMLTVNNSGFKVPTALAASAGPDNGEAVVPGENAVGRMNLATGEVLALVAAGRLPRRHATAAEQRIAALEAAVESLSATVVNLRHAEAVRRVSRFDLPPLPPPPVPVDAEEQAEPMICAECGEPMVDGVCPACGGTEPVAPETGIEDEDLNRFTETGEFLELPPSAPAAAATITAP